MKFMVWDKSQNKYETTKLFGITCEGQLFIFDIFEVQPCEDNYIIELCTGHKDKSGKLIFEGDIIQWDDGIQGRPALRNASVELFPALQFKITKDSPTCTSGYVFEYGRFIYSDTEKYLSIIGNIHEVNNEKDMGSSAQR